jgi:hypothetical protein
MCFIPQGWTNPTADRRHRQLGGESPSSIVCKKFARWQTVVLPGLEAVQEFCQIKTIDRVQQHVESSTLSVSANKSNNVCITEFMKSTHFFQDIFQAEVPSQQYGAFRASLIVLHYTRSIIEGEPWPTTLWMP